jgi:nucleoside-diphosphate-sugar epimerase
MAAARTWIRLVLWGWCHIALALTSHGTSHLNLLILGLGRVGLEIARQALPIFDSVVGTVRSDKALQVETTNDGICRIPFDFDSISSFLPKTTHVVITIPAAENTDSAAQQPALDQIYDEIARGLCPTNSWIGVLSTTGVYGHHDGAWVTEQSPCQCKGDSSAGRFLAMEESWRERARHHRGKHLRLVVFRCAGIYGPDRSALHTVYRKGLVVSQQDSLSVADITNRIHSEDLARAVLGSMLLDDNNVPSTTMDEFRIYNLSDDLPESRQLVMNYAAELLGGIGVDIGSGVATGEPASDRARRRRTDQKRVNNHRMKDELLASSSLLYPTYREGLQAIVGERNNPWWRDKPS